MEIRHAPISVLITCFGMLLPGLAESLTFSSALRNTLTSYGQKDISQSEETVFIKDLTDFPLVEDISILSEDYVFPTPAGTVARFVLRGSKSSDYYLGLYSESLSVLGWQCSLKDERRKKSGAADDAGAAGAAPSASPSPDISSDKPPSVLGCTKEGESLTLTPLKDKNAVPQGTLITLDYKPLSKNN